MKRVLILTESDDVTDLTRVPLADWDAVVLAFWASPEFVARAVEHGARVCWRLNELVSDYPALVRRAYALAHFTAERAPHYRAVNPLRAWENIIANALLVPLVMFAVHTALRERLGNAVEISFLTRNDTQRAFETINTNVAPAFEVRVLTMREASKVHAAGGRAMALRQLVAEARHDGDWRNVFWVPVETLDARYAWRSRGGRPGTAARGGTLFYSSYVNYSRVLAKHAAALEPPPQWVVNSHSARKGLPHGTCHYNLWQFGAPEMNAHASLLADARAALAEVPPVQDNFPLRAALAASREVHEIVARVLPRLLAEVDLMHACLDTLQPESLWVANQWGGEGCMLQVAPAHSIPVTQVQHGLLESYYACAPIYSDLFLVWGDFWRSILDARERFKVRVVNPGFEFTPHARGLPASKIRAPLGVTWFTTPPRAIPFWNPTAVYWETVTVIHSLVQRGCTVTLRAHPMDQIEVYAGAWRKTYGALPPELTFDKGTPLAPLLEHTDVALMVFSTVVLDCLAYGVPVRGLGWYEFMLKSRVETASFIRYANSLDSLQRDIEISTSCVS